MPLLALACLNKDNAATDKNAKEPSESPLKPSDFDGERALAHVRKQVEFGPHWAGSPAIKDVREYIKKELTSYGLKTREDAFRAKTPNPKFPEVDMVNLIAEVPGERNEIIMLASHYDTKWFPDISFVGANDGGSSTGALLEIGRQLAKTKPKYTIWLVFFDGEEAMNGEWEGEDHTYGSSHLAQSLREQGKVRDVKAMILLDMIGDKDLDIRRDGNSINWMNDIIWHTAARLGYSKNFLNERFDTEDDHIPLLQAGVPAVDLIDFNYGPDNSYWHTAQDTIDKISAQSLKVVGDTVLLSLPELSEKIR
jgi:hypothetical protein